MATRAFDAKIVDKYPLPLAVAAQRFNNASHSDLVERHLRLGSMAEETLKYLAILALGHYLADPEPAEELQRTLPSLARPSLGDWLGLTSAILRFYAGHPERPFALRALHQRYLGHLRPNADLPWRDDLLKGGTEAASFLGATMPARSSVCDHLDMLVRYRNRTWGHGTRGLDRKRCGEHLVWLQPMLQGLLLELSFLEEYRPCYVGVVRVPSDENPTALHVGSVFDCTGQLPVRRPEPVPLEGARSHHVYLWRPGGPDGTREPLLSLWPMLLVLRDDLELFDLDSVEHGSLTYASCKDGEPLVKHVRIPLKLAELAKEPKERELGLTPATDAQPAGEPETAPRDLRSLVAQLDPDARHALERAAGESVRLGHSWLGVEFLLTGLSRHDSLREGLPIPPDEVRGALRVHVGVRKPDWKYHDVDEVGPPALKLVLDASADALKVTPRLLQVLARAVERGRGLACPADLLAAALEHARCPAVSVLLGLAARAQPAPHARRQPAQDRHKAATPGRAPAPVPQLHGAAPDAQPPPPAEHLGRDLTAEARAGRLQPATGKTARKVHLQIAEVLGRAQNNNPLLLGDPGVGKTAIVEGFAWRIACDVERPVDPRLAQLRIVGVSRLDLEAGARLRGDFEQRVRALLDEMKKAGGRVVLFADELHALLRGSGDAAGGLGDLIKPALARGELPCIGATTVAEYRRHIEPDAALARRFTPIWVDEPTQEETLEIVGKVARDRLAPRHRAVYSDDVIREAVHLSTRYLPDRAQPAKALDVLDGAGSRVRFGGTLGPEPAAAALAGVSPLIAAVRSVIAEEAHLPFEQLAKDDRERLLSLEDELRRRIKGQEEAVQAVAESVRRARAGLGDPDRPQGVFLFAGPTGVGKTELALALAEVLFLRREACKRLDMSEYMERHQVARLIGAPPGYVGHGEEGQLTGWLRRRPYSVVLLDELEKAHADVQHMLLQVFSAGRLTDGRGNVADGRHALFVMTTNLGTPPIGFKGGAVSPDDALQDALRSKFSPEFLNRIDRVIRFQPLDTATLRAILDLQLEQRVVRRLRDRQIEVTIDDEVPLALLERRLDPNQGARALVRLVEREVVDRLTPILIANEHRPGLRLAVVRAPDGAIAVTTGSSTARRDQQASPAGRMPNRDAEELAALSRLNPSVAELTKALEAKGIQLLLEDGVFELLCSPHWTRQRGADTLEAFERLVRAPLLAQVVAGELKAGDRVVGSRASKDGWHVAFRRDEARGGSS